MFEGGFPHSMKNEYEGVISVIGSNIISGAPADAVHGYNSENEIYLLSDGSHISFPYRTYLINDASVYSTLNARQKTIYDCIFTRSFDGYVREKHAASLLNEEIPEWCMPYIIRLSSEYVMATTSLIYEMLRDRDNSLLISFCLRNPKLLKLAYQRMVSYWNEYYRHKCPRFKDYVGRKLFRECFAPNTNFEKLRLGSEG